MKLENEKLKIVVIGSRGIPCTYGGFETFAERLAVELVERGHKVSVYGQYDEEKNERREFYKDVECINSQIIGQEGITETYTLSKINIPFKKA